MADDSSILIRDQNHVPVAGGQSDTDASVVLPFRIDSLTGRVLVDMAGGGGFTVLPATGVVNSSNTVFTFTQVPTLIVSDGVMLPAVGNNGDVFWTNVGTTVTMVNPPAYSIYGIA